MTDKLTCAISHTPCASYNFMIIYIYLILYILCNILFKDNIDDIIYLHFVYIKDVHAVPADGFIMFFNIGLKYDDLLVETVDVKKALSRADKATINAR